MLSVTMLSEPEAVFFIWGSCLCSNSCHMTVTVFINFTYGTVSVKEECILYLFSQFLSFDNEYQCQGLTLMSPE